MNTLRRFTGTAVVSLILLFTGCATAPENISPAYVSELTYQSYTREQLAQEQGRLVSALADVSDAQRRARSNDTLGVIFLGLPVSSLSGSNQASQVARIKGELAAVQKAAILKGYRLEEVPKEVLKAAAEVEQAALNEAKKDSGAEPMTTAVSGNTPYTNLAPGTNATRPVPYTNLTPGIRAAEPVPTSVEERLSALLRLKDGGYISDAEYQSRRKVILDGI